MLDDTIVNIIRRRNLSPAVVKVQADKWQQAVRTVDWLTTQQIPRDSEFQIYTLQRTGGACVPDTPGQWLDGGDREALESSAMDALSNGTVPAERNEPAIERWPQPSTRRCNPGAGQPDPARPTGCRLKGRHQVFAAARSRFKQRLKLFNEATRAAFGGGLPVNVILFPMEGDPDGGQRVLEARGGSPAGRA